MADQAAAAAALPLPKRDKQPAKVLVAFLYPPADVVNEGKMEDSWRAHNWFTWPGNQFEPEQQERKFTAKIKEIAEKLGVAVEFQPSAIYQEAKVKRVHRQGQGRQAGRRADRQLLEHASPSGRTRWRPNRRPTAIVYHSLGSNHQLPPEYLRNAEGLYYIHSIENWDEIERGLPRRAGQEDARPEPAAAHFGPDAVAAPRPRAAARTSRSSRRRPTSSTRCSTPSQPDDALRARGHAVQEERRAGHGRDRRVLRRRDAGPPRRRADHASATGPTRSPSSACSSSTASRASASPSTTARSCPAAARTTSTRR